MEGDPASQHLGEPEQKGVVVLKLPVICHLKDGVEMIVLNVYIIKSSIYIPWRQYYCKLYDVAVCHVGHLDIHMEQPGSLVGLDFPLIKKSVTLPPIQG